MGKIYIHVRGKGVERLVEVVHLHDDATRNEETEDVRRGASKLVVARQGELDCDAEAFNGHDGNGTDKRADGEVHQWERAPVSWYDEVDHAQREDGHDKTIEQETYAVAALYRPLGEREQARWAHLVVARSARSGLPSQWVCLAARVVR